MKRIEQKEKRRNEILDAALDLFIRKGYSATRTIDIARSVGMSEGLLFHYFKTKEELYFELLKIAGQGKTNIFDLKPSSAIAFFEETAFTIFEYIKRDSFAAKLFVLMNRTQFDEALPEKVRDYLMRKKDIEAAVRWVQQGQREQSIRKGDPLALSLAFFMAIQGIAENIARNPEMPVPNPEWVVDIIRSR